MKLSGILNVTSLLVMAFGLNACTDLAQSDVAPAVALPAVVAAPPIVAARPVVAAPGTAQPVKKVKPPFSVVLPGSGGGGWG